MPELRKMEVSVIGSHITHNGDGTVNYGLTSIKFNREISFEEILAFMDAHPRHKYCNSSRASFPARKGRGFAATDGQCGYGNMVRSPP